MVEIYNKDPEDFNYKENILEITNPTDICVGQLKMMLVTNRGEVLGDPKFGLNLEDLVFSLDLSESSLRERINEHLRIYVPLFAQLNGYFEVKFYQGTQRDIAYLDFYLPGLSNTSPAIALKVS
jgi:hypothetical protein